ncbi:MAG: hypothetical protein HQL46_12450 [Gammaproteobacteria bacterium]|nr:hypothetical protein [Gammaproteobacteria bacterium]
MDEILDQVVGYLKGIWHKRWYGMVIIWLISISGWVYVYQLPDQYESKAKIYIDSQSLLRPLLRGLAIETNVSQEINLMVKTLLTRPNVEKIIRLADLDLSVKNNEQFEALVKELQQQIRFGKSARSRVNLYSLSYSNKNPQVAQKVLQSVITVFVENSIGRNTNDANSAKSFIHKQIESYEKRLTEAENRLKVFKQENVSMLPSSAGGYYSKMEQTKNELASTKLALEESKKSKSVLQNELNALISSIKNSAAAQKQNVFTTSVDARIAKLTADLDSLLLKYTDDYPDVKSTKRVLANLKAQQDLELEVLRRTVSSSGSGLDNNPVYQDLKRELGNSNTKIASLTVRKNEYQKRYDELALLVDKIPEIEAKLTSLNRDYDITKSKYTQLLERRESAALSENINKSTDGVQFNVVDPPRVSNDPVGPNRILLSTGALILSLAAGMGFAFLLSQIKPVFNSPKHLEQVIGLPILGSVSAVISPGQKRRRSLLVMTYLSLFLALLLIYLALIAWYMKGFWASVNSIMGMF